MKKKFTNKDTALKKDIFVTGEYIQHFTPDDKWNPFSKIYQKKKQDTAAIINGAKGHKTILDVGAGMGRLSLELARCHANKVFSADLSVDMLKLASRNSGSTDNLEFVNSDAHLLPFRDQSFDYVVGLDILCHLAEPKKALREFYRVLNHRGILILDSTNSNPLWTLFYPRYLGKNPINWFKTMKFKGVSPGWEKIVKHYPKKHVSVSAQRDGL